jgi:hypothetical protein
MNKTYVVGDIETDKSFYLQFDGDVDGWWSMVQNLTMMVGLRTLLLWLVLCTSQYLFHYCDNGTWLLFCDNATGVHFIKLRASGRDRLEGGIAKAKAY